MVCFWKTVCWNLHFNGFEIFHGTYRNVIGIYIICSFLVIRWHQLYSGMVIGQNVGKSVLRPIYRQISRVARLVSSHMLQKFEFFRESEIWVSCHYSVMFSKILQLYGTATKNSKIRCQSKEKFYTLEKYKKFCWMIKCSVYFITFRS